MLEHLFRTDRVFVDDESKADLAFLRSAMSIKGCPMGLAQEIIGLTGMLLLRVPLAVHFARLTRVHVVLL